MGALETSRRYSKATTRESGLSWSTTCSIRMDGDVACIFLQKMTYLSVVFLFLPLVVITGLGMSPAITASFPFLQSMFGGLQSARTVHFLVFTALVLFAVGHVLMVVLSGFRRQIRSMTIGEKLT